MPLSYWLLPGWSEGDTYSSQQDAPSAPVAPEKPSTESPAAPITDIPTSTTDVTRPRTVAAGYDSDRKVLTVVFREGAVINYFDVDEAEWEEFHASISKGPLLVRGSLLGSKQWRKAMLTDLDPAIYAELTYVARVEQLRHARSQRSRAPGGKLLYATSKTSLRGSRRAGRLPTFNQVSETVSKHARDAAGKNPSKGGKPPKR